MTVSASQPVFAAMHTPAPLIRSLQIGNVWFEERQGGLARVYYELFRHLPAAGVDFEGLVVGSRGIHGQYGGKLSEFAAASESLAARLLKARSAVARGLTNKRVDLVASHFAMYTFPALDKMRDIPLVTHFHGPWSAEAGVEGAAGLRSRLQGFFERSVYRRSQRFIVLSHAFARELAHRYAVPESAIRIVPAGVDTGRFNCNATRRQARERLAWPTDRPILFTVRRLAHRMGLEDLVTAVKTLVQTTPDLLLHIAGVGVLAGELERRIIELGLSGNVRLLGRLDDAVLPLAYRAADISVVPTVALEGFGMITLESLACGTPVLVTPVGGLPEAVRNLSSALIFDATGPEALARGLAEALRGERKLPTDAECRLYTEKNFTWPLIAQRTRDVYAEAISS